MFVLPALINLNIDYVVFLFRFNIVIGSYGHFVLNQLMLKDLCMQSSHVSKRDNRNAKKYC